MTASASQSVRGTPTYMAPEQCLGRPVPASDQYALAIMAYELLAGRPPFQGGPMQVMYQHLQEQPPFPSTLNTQLTKDVEAVLLRALSKKAEERFASITLFAYALKEAIQMMEFAETVRGTNTTSPSTDERTHQEKMETTYPLLASSAITFSKGAIEKDTYVHNTNPSVGHRETFSTIPQNTLIEELHETTSRKLKSEMAAPIAQVKSFVTVPHKQSKRGFLLVFPLVILTISLFALFPSIVPLIMNISSKGNGTITSSQKQVREENQPSVTPSLSLSPSSTSSTPSMTPTPAPLLTINPSTFYSCPITTTISGPVYRCIATVGMSLNSKGNLNWHTSSSAPAVVTFGPANGILLQGQSVQVTISISYYASPGYYSFLFLGPRNTVKETFFIYLPVSPIPSPVVTCTAFPTPGPSKKPTPTPPPGSC